MIRVLLADESPTARLLLVELLLSDPGIEVVGEARTGAEAIALCWRHRPDLVIMDLHLPVIDGLAATREIMEVMPTPVILVSSIFALAEIDVSAVAAESGAVMVLPKPDRPDAPHFAAQGERLLKMVRAMAVVKVVRRWRTPGPASAARPPRAESSSPIRLVAIAASTGGPTTLQRIFNDLGRDFPVPVLVVQHIASGFVGSLVQWLDATCALRVRVAEAGAALERGTVYFAPDDFHLGVTPELRAALSRSEPIGGFRPSANHLFRSVARSLGPAAAAVILTGMGRDGVAGLGEIVEAGGAAFAQDEQSSVVFGMPREALRAGVVSELHSAADLGACLSNLVRKAVHA